MSGLGSLGYSKFGFCHFGAALNEILALWVRNMGLRHQQLQEMFF